MQRCEDRREVERERKGIEVELQVRRKTRRDPLNTNNHSDQICKNAKIGYSKVSSLKQRKGKEGP